MSVVTTRQEVCTNECQNSKTNSEMQHISIKRTSLHNIYTFWIYTSHKFVLLETKNTQK